jgi:hypothetical protein
MQNIDILIGRLSQEQARAERLLLRDLAQLSVTLSSCMEEQQKQLDHLRSQTQVLLSALATKVRDGYAEGHDPDGQEEPLPAIITGRRLSDEERKAIMSTMVEQIEEK